MRSATTFGLIPSSSNNVFAVCLKALNRICGTSAVLQDPVLTGDTLTYTAKVLKGEMPARGELVSVFIDVVGMPATPVSYAGVARRSYRRAVIYH